VPHSLLFEDVILVSCIRGQCILETHLPILNTIEVNGAGLTGLNSMICAQLYNPYQVIVIDTFDSQSEFKQLVRQMA